MKQNNPAVILRAILKECMWQVDKKEIRMRALLYLEFPEMQTAETIDRFIAGFLTPLTLLRPRQYTEKKRKQVVEDRLKLFMGRHHQFKDQCLSILLKLDNNELGEQEIKKNIIQLINQKEILFKPTIADLQMAELMGDLDKYGYEVIFDKRGRKLIAKKRK